ncbi:adenylosuccinate lyase [uncultured Polaribacter sp.]|uniref:adenylosuccinate lyase n=1 Tax=uncultured Polaribacter sp. TaxID=174711 RepID=UPI002626700E|nr:adenylosuccinate lyase [uncultured Polaribacter sp.]
MSTPNQLYLLTQLNNMQTAAKENRNNVANIVLENKNLFAELVSITFWADDKISIKAAWILEWICTHESIDWILPYLEQFTQNITHLKFDSAIRPCAKICEHLANAYFHKKENKTKKTLTTQQIEAIVTTGFDWLITPQKIAVRAYTMNTLYLFGLKNSWIHPELKHLIESKIIHESKGTKARGKQILLLIEKHKKFE